MELNKELLFEKSTTMLKEASKCGATQTQISIKLRSLSLTRLANSIIDQNVSERHAKVTATLYFGKRSGEVEFESLQDKQITNSIKYAAKIAQISPENQDFNSLPVQRPYDKNLNTNQLVSEATYNSDPEIRAEYATLAIETAHSLDKRISSVAGFVADYTIEKVIANSLGIQVHEACTQSFVRLTITAKNTTEATGWYQSSQRNIKELQVERVSQIASEKAINGFGTKNLAPGEYEVILEPFAFTGMMFWIAFYTFSAKRLHDFQSFLRDRIGEQVFDSNLTLVNNPMDQRLIKATRFDDEGVTTKKLPLIEKGIFMNFAYDNITSTKDNVENTGNHIRTEWYKGPAAVHMIAPEGDSSIDEMISETEKGVLVTHFHYQNPVNPAEGVFTGLTRDGTWLIENGEIVYPLATLRYTDAAPRFLKQINLIGKYSEPVDSYYGLMPAIKLPSFRFSGSSME